MPSTSVKVNSRVGKIEPRRSFPVFVVREANGAGSCGHQHSTITAARNCGENVVRRTRREGGVFECNADGTSTRKVIIRVAE